ncbi:MAG: Flp family type IVb pilin [Sphingomonadales bacterium]|nr:Flp family type IVb pilin [Sphingomonadales bacterium]MDE2167987.1 Flp family type IVb pilin [Sphingomonadales bacterium]
MSIHRLLARLARDDKAMASVEYGLICALIILAMLTALSGFANVIQGTWGDITTQSSSAIGQATAA